MCACVCVSVVCAAYFQAIYFNSSHFRVRHMAATTASAVQRKHLHATPRGPGVSFQSPHTHTHTHITCPVDCLCLFRDNTVFIEPNHHHHHHQLSFVCVLQIFGSPLEGCSNCNYGLIYVQQIESATTYVNRRVAFKISMRIKTDISLHSGNPLINFR